jgi:hypothetical protein
MAKEGRPYRVDRKSSDSITVENLAVSVLGGIQPAKMKAIKAGLTDDGLLQRFHPISITNVDEGEDIAPDPALKENLQRVAFELAGLERAGVFRFSPEADTEFRALEAFKKREIARPDSSLALCQWLDKLPNEFGRVALAFHFIEWHSSPLGKLDGGAPSELVSIETARRARRYLTEFVYPHARLFYERVLGASAAGSHALWIAGFVLAHDRATVVPRDVERGYSALRGRENRRALLDAMHALELEGWVRPTRWQANGSPKEWKVNPAVHDGRFQVMAEAEHARRAAIREKIAEAAKAQTVTTGDKGEPGGGMD